MLRASKRGKRAKEKTKEGRLQAISEFKNSHFENEAKCKTFLVRMSFICMKIKNHFYINGFALNLALKQRLGAFRKWSDSCIKHVRQTSVSSLDVCPARSHVMLVCATIQRGSLMSPGAWIIDRLPKGSISRGETVQKKRLYFSVTVFSSEILIKNSVFTSPK